MKEEGSSRVSSSRVWHILVNLTAGHGTKHQSETTAQNSQQHYRKKMV